MRTGDWICTVSGGKWYITDPHPADVEIVDIAHALSMICRYGGHSREFYSVAQHSVLVLRAVMRAFPENRQAHAYALLHDASEAYLGDLVRPLKLTMPVYRALELKTERVILEALGVPPPDSEAREIVKHFDNVLLMTERRDLVNHGGHEWRNREEPLPDIISPESCALACTRFLNAWDVVKGGARWQG